MNTKYVSRCYLYIVCTILLVTTSAKSAVAQYPVFLFPPAYVTVTSGPSTSGAYWITTIDATGDDDVAAQPLVGGVPLGFTFDPTGKYGESLQAGNSIDYFPAGAALQPSTVFTNSVPDSSCTSSVTAPTGHLFTLDYKTSSINLGYPSGTVAGQFAISAGDAVGTTPVTMTGNPSTGRYFVISQNIPYGVACNNIPHLVSQTGTATVFQATTGATSGVGAIALGRCPVFGTTSSDGQRSFVLNRGDDSITVINVLQAVVDAAHPIIALTKNAGTTAGPVYAEYVARLGKLLVANYENDTVSVINVQLDENGLDGPAFGTIENTVDLWQGSNAHTNGKHPAAITALADGTRAYIANQEDGSVSVLDLRLNEIVSTLSLNPCQQLQTNPCSVKEGIHPRTIASISNAETNSLFAKVYVGAPDGNSIPYIIAEDNQLILPACLYNESNPGTCAPDSCPSSNGVCAITGNVDDLHVVAQDSSLGANSVITTRIPGAGQPCASATFSPSNLAACLLHPTVQ